MCHSNLEVTLHPNVNVITGANGSGKSAILTGIQVCFGAKTGTTNRATSIKDLIKSDAETASVTVHLQNEGRDAYRPDLYGDTIIVEKRITKQGGSSYLIKDANGEVVSRKFKDLKLIMEQFNIQINNPCCIMTQDVSRQFLASSKPQDRYKFFLQATLLQKMLDEFEFINNNKVTIEQILKQKREALETKKAQLEKHKQEYDEAVLLLELQTKADNLRDEYVWAIVREAEEKVNHCTQIIEEEQKKKEKYENILNTQKSSYEELEKKRDEMTAKGEKITQKINEISDQIAEIAKQIADKTRMESNMRAQIISVQRSIAEQQKIIKDYQKRIREIEEKSAVDKDAEKKKREEKIERMKQEQENARKRMQELEEEIKKLDEERQQVIEQGQKIGRDMMDIRRKLDAEKKEVRRLKGQRRDKLGLFGQPVIDLLKDLAKYKHRFKHVPIGPIGLFITLKDLKWGTAVERGLSNSLTNFICDNHNDDKLLKELINKHFKGKRVATIVQKFTTKQYNTENERPDRRFITFEDMITLDEKVIKTLPIQFDSNILKATIFNSLIDQAEIEKKILIEKNADAIKIMFEGRTPQHVSECFTINGTRLFVRGRSHILLPNDNPSRFFCPDFEQQIRALENKILRRQKEHDEIEKEEKILSDKRRALESESKSKSREIPNLRKKIYNLKAEIDQLMNEQEDKEEDTQTIINQWKDSIKLCENKIAEYEKKIEEIEERMKNIQSEIEELKKQRNILRKKKEQVENESEEYTREMTTILRELSLAKMKGDKIKKRIEKIEHNIKTKSQEKHAHEEALKSQLEHAKKLCPTRINTQRQSNEIQIERNAMINRVRQESQKFGRVPLDTIKNRYLESKKTYDSTLDMIRLSEQNFNFIKEGIVERLGKWKNIRFGFAKLASQKFNANLGQKGHTGELVFEHEKGPGTLEFKIKLQSKTLSSEDSVTDTKSLSGGERSFATVSFLMALWEIVESPFRALDEFDIFMDGVYRKKALELLISLATKKHKNTQLIIITPHDTSMIQGDKDRIKIVRLRDPVRSGQTAITDYIQ